MIQPPAEPEGVTRKAWSVSVFARHEGALLLIHHKRLGTWLPVGGEVEPGETPLEAARRELREETGLLGVFPLGLGVDGTPAGLLGYEEHLAGTKGLHMNFAFVAEVSTRDVQPNDEFADFRWIPPDEDLSALPCPENVRQLLALARAVGNVERAYELPLRQLALRWLDAFNGRDLDALVSLYAPDAVHLSPKLRDRQPETKGEIRGVPALRAWWQGAMERLPGLHYEPLHITCGPEADGRVFMEYLRTAPGEADMVVAEVLVVRVAGGGAGRIVSSCVFHG